MTDPETRRAEIADKLKTLRAKTSAPVAALVRQADAAVAAYRSEADALEGQLLELDAELGVREMDRRAVAAQEREASWLAQRQALLAEEETRLQAIADAEAAARGLLDAVNRTLASQARMAKIAQGLSTSRKVPSALSLTDLASRMGGRIAGLMVLVKGHRNRLGGIEWIGGALFSPDRNWRDDEEKTMAAQVIGPLLSKGNA